MTEPKRWRDDPATSAGLRELLESFPSPSALPKASFANVQESLETSFPEARPGTPAPSAGAATGAKSTTLLGLGVKLTMGTLFAGGFALVLSGSIPSVEDMPKTPRTSAPSPTRTVALPDHKSAQAPEPQREDSSSALPAPLPRPAAATPQKVRPLSLRKETELLERARLALERDPREAERRLREYDVCARNPALEIERNLLEIEVLTRLGQRARALRAAERTLRAAPGSVYAPRVASLMEKLRSDAETRAGTEGTPRSSQSIGIKSEVTR